MIMAGKGGKVRACNGGENGGVVLLAEPPFARSADAVVSQVRRAHAMNLFGHKDGTYVSHYPPQLGMARCGSMACEASSATGRTERFTVV